MKKKYAYRTALSGILCALAIALSFLESLLPSIPFLPPGAKPGLSNIITMFAASSLALPDLCLIIITKSAFVFITRGATSAAMSLSGGILSGFAMFLLFRFCKDKLGLTGISVISALCHNAGQLLTSTILTGTSKTLYYAPFLAIFAIITGTLSGIIFKAVLPLAEKHKKYFMR